MNLIYHPNIDHIAKKQYDLVSKKLAKAKKGRAYFSDSVYVKTEKYKTKYHGTTNYDLFEYLHKEHYKLITDKVPELEKHIKAIAKIISINKIKFKSIDKDGKLKPNDIYEAIQDSFDYAAFSSSEKPYEILKELGVDVCPYCNRQFVNTFTSDDGKTRATLDHFYAKSDYPYLALSFYNLVPSCYSCNCSLKGKKEFSLGKNINPFHSSFEKVVSFTINYNKTKGSKAYIAEFYANPDYMKIGFKELVNKTTKAYKCADRNIKTFKLEELYNLHKDFVLRLLQQDVIYNKSGYATTLKNKYSKIFNDEDEVLKTLIGYYADHKEFNKSPFSRLIRDITIELDLQKKLT